MAFSPDGVDLPGQRGILATSSVDETVRLWSLEGELLHTLRGHRSGVRAIAFHPHQPILASAGDDQMMILWHLDQILTLDPLTAACAWVGDYLRTNAAIGPDEAALCRHRR